MLEEFKKFALRGNVVDIIMPVIGAITGGLDFSNYFIALSKNVTATAYADAKKQGAVFGYGQFLSVTLNFVIVAFVLFLVIRAMNQLTKREEARPKPAEPSLELKILTDIRDILA